MSTIYKAITTVATAKTPTSEEEQNNDFLAGDEVYVP